MTKISRNDPCPCGSGKKYKKCCAVKKAVPPLSSRSVSCLSSQQAQGARVFSALESIRSSSEAFAEKPAKPLSERISKK